MEDKARKRREIVTVIVGIGIVVTLVLWLAVRLCQRRDREVDELQDYPILVSNEFRLPFKQLEGYENLYYDESTRIVYFINCQLVSFKGTYRSYSCMTPYYASNGKPYQYDPETKELREVN